MKKELDRLDELIAEWNKERPELDTRAMHCVGRILRLGQILDGLISRELKEFNLHYTDFDILATLRRKGKPYQLTPTELSSAVLITSGAMTAALNRLENAKLVGRAGNQNDGRVRLVSLTRTGVKVIDKAIQMRFQQAEDCVVPLNLAEQKKLATLLSKLLVALDTQS